MYGLKQAAILVYKQLVQNLGQPGYYPIPYTTGLWKHKTRDTVFALCVDDFGVKYTSKETINHLIAQGPQKVPTSGPIPPAICSSLMD